MYKMRGRYQSNGNSILVVGIQAVWKLASSFPEIHLSISRKKKDSVTIFEENFS